jgi:hypothetical protein
MSVESRYIYIYKSIASGITRWSGGTSWGFVREDGDFGFYVETTEKEPRKGTLELVHNGKYHHLVAGNYHHITG